MKLYKKIDKTFKAWEREYKKGFTAYIILYFLSEIDMYGYEIKIKLEEFVKSTTQFQESSMWHLSY